MRITIKQFLNISEGILATSLLDNYQILGYIFDVHIMPHELPRAINRVKLLRPDWYLDGLRIVSEIKEKENTKGFMELLEIVDKKYNNAYVNLDKLPYK